MLNRQYLAMFAIFLLVAVPLSVTAEPSTVGSVDDKTTTAEPSSTVGPVDKTTTSDPAPWSSTTIADDKETTTSSAVSSSEKELSSPEPTPSSSSSSTTTTTTTAQPQYSTEWQDIEETESQKLVSFVVSEIQKLKVEHKELDECQELDLSSVLSGKKLNGKAIKYSVTLKVQPQVKNTEECLKQNATMTNMHPEICEADVTEGDRGGTDGKTLLRSTCLQVEELQD